MNYNLVNFCEFDKHAVESYCAIHGEDESKNLGDITKVCKLPKCDLLTYGFPCQDISIAGKQEGIKQGTRSGLLLEVEKLLEQAEYKPKFLLMENVKNLIGGKHRNNFDNWLNKLDEIGYNSYWSVLNAKDYKIPQNRERVFCLSVRKDIDCDFEFPKPTGVVDWTSFLSLDDTRSLTGRQQRMIDFALGKNTEDNIVIEGVNQFDKAVILLRQSGLRFYKNKELPTLCASMGKGGGNFPILVYKGDYGGLSPLQCFKLMGFDDVDFHKVKNIGVSNSDLYTQAGNSIVVDVLVEIYKQMQKYYPNDFTDYIDVVTLFSGIGAFEKALKRI